MRFKKNIYIYLGETIFLTTLADYFAYWENIFEIKWIFVLFLMQCSNQIPFYTDVIQSVLQSNLHK